MRTCTIESQLYTIIIEERKLTMSGSDERRRRLTDASSRMKDIVLREREMLETLLNADDRNFHAWNYRRFLIDTISRYHFSDDYRRNKEEEVGVIKKRTREEETKYAREKISKNFSNYSAWHHRSVHFEQFDEGRDDEEGAENPSSSSSSKLSLQFQAVLNAEFELVSQAFFTEPEDQSAWMYHRWLLSQLDEYSSSSSSSKKAYKIQTLQRELHRIRDVSEMEPTCKWPALCAAPRFRLGQGNARRRRPGGRDDARGSGKRTLRKAHRPRPAEERILRGRFR